MRETLHAPYLIDVEVAYVVRRYTARGDIDGELGRRARRLAASSSHRARIELA